MIIYGSYNDLKEFWLLLTKQFLKDSININNSLQKTNGDPKKPQNPCKGLISTLHKQGIDYMKKINKILSVLVVLLIIIAGLFIVQDLVFSKNSGDHYNFSSNNQSNTNFQTQILGSDELGSVTLEGPYGNPDSANKIAIIVGVHPFEFKSHNSFLKYLKQYNNSLNNSYYVYIVDVTQDKDDFDKSRMNGQLVAQKFAVPDITSKNYNFCVDVHGHRDQYVLKNSIVAPLNDGESLAIAKEISKKTTGVGIMNYVPASDGHPTSPEYVSIPILKSGTPIIIYETSIYQSQDIIDKYMEEFLLGLDSVRF
jgi:hypothetical protein